MRDFFNFISGVILGLLPVIFISFIGIFIYASFSHGIAVSIIVILEFFALWIGYYIFNEVQFIGFIEFSTSKNASQDLDNLELKEGSKTRKVSPKELELLIEKEENIFKEGTIRIFGDWFGKRYKNIHRIRRASYNEETEVLKLEFEDTVVLTIVKPIHIFEAPTFFKIVHAESIELTWKGIGISKDEKKAYFLNYSKGRWRVNIKSNLDKTKFEFNASLGEPALVVYGYRDT